ncbi:MAG TPA: hypothetical protein VGH19_06525 [Verrucomicrobiae bacterium]
MNGFCPVCGGENRPGQGRCHRCHRLAEAYRRDKVKRELVGMRKMRADAWKMELAKWRPLTTRDYSITFYQGM